MRSHFFIRCILFLASKKTLSGNTCYFLLRSAIVLFCFSFYYSSFPIIPFLIVFPATFLPYFYGIPGIKMPSVSSLKRPLHNIGFHKISLLFSYSILLKSARLSSVFGFVNAKSQQKHTVLMLLKSFQRYIISKLHA